MYTEIKRETKGSVETTDKTKLTRYKCTLKNDKEEVFQGYYVAIESLSTGDIAHHWEIEKKVFFDFEVRCSITSKKKSKEIVVEKNTALPQEEYQPGRLF